ncbi:MAG: hypothetical protein WBI06_00630 [Paludibacter sp.]
MFKLPQIRVIGGDINAIAVSSSVAGNGVPIQETGVPIWDAEVLFGMTEFHSGSRSFIQDDGVSFGMTEFRLRQYSPI